MAKNDNVKSMHIEDPSIPEVESEVTVERSTTIPVAPADGFADLLNQIEHDVNEKYGDDVNADNNFVMVQFMLNDDENDDSAGQVFIKTVNVAERDVDGRKEGLIILNVMSRQEYDDILTGKQEGADVLKFEGLRDILKQINDVTPLNTAQILVSTEGTGAHEFVGGDVQIENDSFHAAVPQRVIYEPGDGKSPKILYIQI